MLTDLYLLQTYFSEPATLAYEDDLVQRYGRHQVSQAIHKGWLDHRYVPCGREQTRCVCRLSAAGIEEAKKQYAADRRAAEP